jgi:D-arabinose 5-phosphate isomerase GutQ
VRGLSGMVGRALVPVFAPTRYKSAVFSTGDSLHLVLKDI